MTQTERMRITVNSQSLELERGAPLASALAAAGIDPARRGIAVALDGTVVPRSRWAVTALEAGACLEVVTATQGG